MEQLIPPSDEVRNEQERQETVASAAGEAATSQAFDQEGWDAYMDNMPFGD